jgi:hypothetical protein
MDKKTVIKNIGNNLNGKSIQQGLQERIEELLSMEPLLIGSDEGTHNRPLYYNIYQDCLSEPYAVRMCNGVRSFCSVENANLCTYGSIRMFKGNIALVEAYQKELGILKEELEKRLTE